LCPVHRGGTPTHTYLMCKRRLVRLKRLYSALVRGTPQHVVRITCMGYHSDPRPLGRCCCLFCCCWPRVAARTWADDVSPTLDLTWFAPELCPRLAKPMLRLGLPQVESSHVTSRHVKSCQVTSSHVKGEERVELLTRRDSLSSLGCRTHDPFSDVLLG